MNVPTVHLSKFLLHHRGRLLRYLDGIAPAGPAEPDPLRYVEEVLAEWSSLPSELKRVPADGAERTFWYALYTLEDLVENPARGGVDPYEAILLQNLAAARELLRKGRELPAGHDATRPDEFALFNDTIEPTR